MSEVIDYAAIQRGKMAAFRANTKRPMTAEEFLWAYEGVEGKWELVEGVPVMMAGAKRRHNQVAINIIVALRLKLSGSPCQPFGSDMGVHVHTYQVRYPDVSVLCDPRDDIDELQQMRHPSALFEVFSKSTADEDKSVKLPEYKTIPSVRAIVFVDPVAETVVLHERASDDTWLAIAIERGGPVRLCALGLELSAHDIFRRD